MTDFHERQKSLFNQLKEAEEQCGFSKSNRAVAEPDYGVIDKVTYRRLKSEMKQFRGKESIFKRPEASIRACLKNKTIPDHIVNPKKWVYYTLSDVTEEQMSNATNTATALALMQKSEDRAAEESVMETDTDSTGAVFKKPAFHISARLKKDVILEEEDKPVFRSTKLIMPEYVVGVSQSKVKKEKLARPVKIKNCEKKADLKLDHLFNEEADDE